MSRPTWDELKLPRDRHLQPVAVVGDLPNPPRGRPSRMLWAIERGEDGMPARMFWMGPACEARSVGGWRCVCGGGHEGEHVGERQHWIVLWGNDGSEHYEVRGCRQ